MRCFPAILAAILTPLCHAQASPPTSPPTSAPNAELTAGLTLAQALSLAHAPAPPAAGDQAALSLEEVRSLALEGQPQLLQLAARARAARENASAEGQLPDPRLTLGLSNLPVDSLSFTREDMTQAMVGISQMVPGGDKLRLASRRMSLEASQAEAELAAARLRIARDASRAWLDWYAPRQALELVQRIAAEFDRQVEWAGVAYATGGLGLADTLELRLMREYVLDQQAELRRQEAKARLELARWVGDVAARLPDTARLPEPPARDPKAWEAALDGHPELAVLGQGLLLARAEADLAREAYTPDWSVDLGYGLRGGNRADMISVVVGVELPVFPKQRQDRRLAARLAGVESVAGELADRRRQLAAELGMALAELLAAERRIAHFESTLIPLAQRRVESSLVAYRTGRAEFSMVLEARRAELEARLQLLDQQVARARASIDLHYALGEATTTSAAQPVNN